MPIGTIKYWNEAKGFGFISSDGSDESTFVHIRDVMHGGLDSLAVGQSVSFDIGPGRNGRTKATNLELLD